MHGLLVLDKRYGVSSFDEIRALRRILRTRRLGHAGTLDPMATGILLVCVGDATRLVPWLQSAQKTYEAELRFGWETSTDDAEGESVEEGPLPGVLDEETLAPLLRSFEGKVLQTPPAHSAIRIDGQRAYALARAGQEVEMPTREVEIHGLDVLSVQRSEGDLRLRFRATVGKGTYIRSLARDIARALGSRGHLSALRRTRSGVFEAERDAHGSDALARCVEEGRALPLVSCADAIAHLPAVALRAEEAIAVRQGKKLPAEGAGAPATCADQEEGAPLRLLAPEGELLAVGAVEVRDGARILRVLRGMPTGA